MTRRHRAQALPHCWSTRCLAGKEYAPGLKLGHAGKTARWQQHTPAGTTKERLPPHWRKP